MIDNITRELAEINKSQVLYSLVANFQHKLANAIYSNLLKENEASSGLAHKKSSKKIAPLPTTRVFRPRFASSHHPLYSSLLGERYIK